MTAEEAIGVIGFYMASDSMSQEERERKAIRALNAYANTRAVQIAEKAVREERKNWGDKNPIGGALNNVLSQIKTEIGGES